MSEKSIGIDEIREAKRFASSPPVIQSEKFIIIPQAETLTQEAQNALLKLLEEPPTYLKIILAVPNKSQLLETITSRCHTIYGFNLDNNEFTNAEGNILAPLLSMPAEKRLDLLPPVTTKLAGLTYCHQLMAEARIMMAKNPSAITSSNVAILLTCQTRLQQNSNPTLAITDATLSLLPLSAKPATMP